MNGDELWRIMKTRKPKTTISNLKNRITFQLSA